MYIVAGVSGNTGSAVADALLAAGKPVRVLVRDGAKAEPWRRRGAQVAVASLDDPVALGAALRGGTGAYLLSPQNPISPDPIGDGWRIADAIARAVEDSDLGHLVLLSAVYVAHDESAGLTRTLRAAEARLARVRTPISFVRAAYLMENWAAVVPAAASGTLPTFLRPDQLLPMVATRDVAAVAAAALLEGPGGARQILEVVGPREYCPSDVAAALAGLQGRPVQAELVPLEALPSVLARAGASAAFAEQVREMYAAIDSRPLALGSGGARVCRGPTGLGAFFAPLVKETAAAVV